MSHFGALSAATPLPSVAPPIGAQLGTALGQLPGQIQAAQLQQGIMQEQSAELDDRMLQRLAQEAQANPQLLESPMARNFLERVYRKRGLPLPLDSSGKVDLNSIMPPDPQRDNATLASLGQAALVNPAVLENTNNASTITRILQSRGLDASSFQKDGKWDASALAALQPETAGVTERVMTTMSQILQKVADPKGGGPEAAMAELRVLAPQIAVANRIPLGDVQSTILGPALHDALSKRADLETQALVALDIIKPTQEAAYKSRILEQNEEKIGLRKAEDKVTAQYKMGMLANAKQQLAVRSQAVQVSAGRLSVYAKQVNGQLMNAQNATAVRSLSAQMNVQGQLLKQAQADYEKAAQAWQTAVNNGYTPDQSSPLYQAMVQAKQAMLDAQSNITTYQGLLSQFPQAAANAITPGTSYVVPVGGFDISKAVRTGTLNGRKVYQMPDGHVYDANGSVVQ